MTQEQLAQTIEEVIEDFLAEVDDARACTWHVSDDFLYRLRDNVIYDWTGVDKYA